MPRLNRPITDLERILALQKAKRKVDMPSPLPSPLSLDTIAHLNLFLPQLEQAMQLRANALANQASTVKSIGPARNAVRRHIKHFIRVFNLGIERETFRPEDRGFYSLDISSDQLPILRTDSALKQWAHNIATGEQARTLAGGTPMAMPSAAEVAFQFNVLVPLLGELTNSKDNYDRSQQHVQDLRNEADLLIADIWDEVLFAYRKETPPSLRRKAREYGVMYRPSGNTKKANSDLNPEDLTTDDTEN
jgi:hypothetical protein